VIGDGSCASQPILGFAVFVPADPTNPLVLQNSSTYFHHLQFNYLILVQLVVQHTEDYLTSYQHSKNCNSKQPNVTRFVEAFFFARTPFVKTYPGH
jgi:predicted alpha/beta hydrolase family esterase